MRVHATQVLFTSGEDGYHTYRIPALLVTRASTLLAFCEGRKHDGGDHGEIHLLLKRSEDGGRTWSPQQIVWADGPNTCGNPCPVQDSATGTIWLPSNWNRPGRSSYDYFNAYETRYVYMMSSDDDGRTWSPPRDITANVKPRNWGWHSTGPCTGIELRRGPHRRRLLIPCCNSLIGEDACPQYSHVIYSDDHGTTWRTGGMVATEEFDECQVVELRDGCLLMNSRHADPPGTCRGLATSDDGGLSWSPMRYEPALIEPEGGCQGSMIALPDGRLLFSNPASTLRERMTIHTSNDDGITWLELAVLHSGPAAYSSLAMLPDGQAACLYECGADHPYQTITFERFAID